MKSKLIKSSWIYFVSQIISALVTLFAYTIYTDKLTTADFGLFSLTYGLAVIIVSIMTGWISTSILRYSKELSEKKSQSFSEIVILITMIYFVVISICVYLTMIKSNFFFVNPLLFVLVFISTSLNQLFTSYTRAFEYLKTYSLAQILLPCVRLLSFIILVNFFSSNTEIILISFVIGDFASIIIHKWNLKFIRPKFSLKGHSHLLIKQFVKYGFPLMLSSVMLWILGYSDRFLIKYFYSNSEVGIYSIGYDIINRTISVILFSLAAASFPLIIEAWNKSDFEETSKILSDSITLFTLISLPLVILVSIFDKHIFILFFDPMYFEGHKVVSWIAIGTMMFGISHNFLNRIWQLSGKTNKIMLLTLTTAILNFLLNIIFIPRFGYISAAVSTFLSFLFYMVLSIYFVNKTIRINFDLKRLWSFTLSSTIMYMSSKFIMKYISIKNIFILFITSSLLIFIYSISVVIIDKHTRVWLLEKFNKHMIH